MPGNVDHRPDRHAFIAEILHRKDFWSAILYIALGAVTIVSSLEYEFGGPSNMGPGFFPTVLSTVLVIIGGIIGVRVFATAGGGQGSSLGFVNWKALLLVSGSTVLFGLLLPYAGLLIALPVLMLTGAAASRYFRIEPRALFGMIALSGACALVFVVGLGVPMPLLGSLFGG